MKIILVSDTHLTPRAAAFTANWQAIARAIEADDCDLVVHLGDISADGAGDVSELDRARAIFAPFDGRMRFLPGNHDIGDNPDEPGAASKHPLDLARLADYRRIFGADRWAFRAEAWHVIGLNAMLFATGTAEEEAQFVWLEHALEGRRGPIGLMLHKPLFRDRPSDTEVHERYVPHAVRQRLLAHFAKHDLRFVVAGHTHQLRRLNVDGVEHVWAPSTAFCIPEGMQERIGEKEVGMLTLTLEKGGHRFDYVRPEGVVRHNILDYPEVYEELAAIKARLGASAVL
jgi:3',5'-cyclic AMP phosphodiesterase CpdA